MLPQPDSPAASSRSSRYFSGDLVFTRISLNYPRNRKLTVNPASEEHGHTEVTFKIMGGFFLAQQIDVKQVIPKVDVKGDRVV